jgi:hypothetical protein
MFSLRWAINQANADPTPSSIINFNTGPLMIRVTSPLPTITHPTLLDGYSPGTGASPNSLAVGDNAVLTVELNGAGLGANGLVITAAKGVVALAS